MRQRITAFARSAGDYIPDATAIAVLLIVVLAATAVSLGTPVAATLDAFYRGLWMLLPFTMQMALVLVLSATVSATPAFRRGAIALAALPRTTTQVVVLSVLLSAVLGYLYWGLMMALGPLIAAHFARAAEAKGLRVDFPCLLAAQFASGSVWQYGLSSSPALLVATPGHFLESSTGVMPLSSTIWSTPSLVLVIVFPLVVAVVARLVMPRDVQPLSAFPKAARLLAAEPDAVGAAPAAARGLARWSEESRLPPLVLCACLAAWLYHHFVTKAASLDLNAMVTALLLLALLLTGTLAAFARGVQQGVQACWQVLVLYNLYAAVAGLLQFTPVGERFAAAFAAISTPLTFPLLTATAGSVVALLVPSSGGQWIVQGFVTTQAAAAVGATPQLGLLALGIGDQVGTLVSPFWLIVICGMVGMDFRTIFGYALLFAALWFSFGVAVFTFLPA